MDHSSFDGAAVDWEIPQNVIHKVKNRRAERSKKIVKHKINKIVGQR